MFYLMKAVNKATFDVSRALMSVMSSLHHFRRSQVTLLLEPRLSYFLTNACKSFSTLIQPSRTTLSGACRAGGGGGTRRVSSDSLSTACKDKTSPLMLRKLSADPLPIPQLKLILVRLHGVAGVLSLERVIGGDINALVQYMHAKDSSPAKGQ